MRRLLLRPGRHGCPGRQRGQVNRCCQHAMPWTGRSETSICAQHAAILVPQLRKGVRSKSWLPLDSGSKGRKAVDSPTVYLTKLAGRRPVSHPGGRSSRW